jgi:predicted MPP superfamily phosphohydrolase
MSILVVLYNVLLAGFDFAALRRTPKYAPALVFTSSLLLAILLGLGSRFRVMGLFAYGIFLHVPAALFATAFFLRASTRATAVCATLAAGLAGVGVFCFAIEPFRLEVSRVLIESPKITAPLRIALVSDLQMDHVSDYERDVLARLMAEAPDLILFSGDYVQIADDARRRAIQTELRAVMKEVRLSAPLGAFAVAGNVDAPDWPRIFDGLPVEVVQETARFELPGISLTALSLWDSFDVKLGVPQAGFFHVTVGHAPNYALGKIEADLLLAGHTHGGQVRIPFLGPILTLSRIPRSWAAGRTELSESRTLVVSRGIGMERGPAPRLRFLCRPELVLIELRGVEEP